MIRAVLLLVSLSVAAAVPLQDSSLDLLEIVYQNEPSMVFLGSPSIVRTSRGTLLASHDFFGSNYNGKPRVTIIFASTNDGVNWRQISTLSPSYWSTLTVYNGSVYAIGTMSDYGGGIIVYKSADDGQSWTSLQVFGGSFATGPTPIVIASGVLYRAIEYWNAPYRWPNDFDAAVIACNLSYAPHDATLTYDPIMDKRAWTLSPPLVYNTSWSSLSMTAPGYLEGNIVVLPPAASLNEPRILNVLRFNSDPYANRAIILEYNRRQNTLGFVSFIDPFYGGMSKFTVRYDPHSRAYLTISNVVNNKLNNTSQRNVLVLCYTFDVVGLQNWTIATTLLQDDTGLDYADSIKYTGFHYVDWQFDHNQSNSSTGDGGINGHAPTRGSCIRWNEEGCGDDIIYAIRTSYRGANSYHNSNRITFKVLHNFRRYLNITATTSAAVATNVNTNEIAEL